MTVEVTHPFVNEKADGADPTVVKPSDWNANHVVDMSADGLIGRPPGAGAGVADVVAWADVGAGVLPSGLGPLPFSGSVVPAGWLLCYGQAVSRTTYARLFAAIGTAYGVGDGSTTFNVPDMRGRIIVGKDDMGGVAANRVTNGVSGFDATVLGASGGAQSKTPAATLTGANTNSLTKTSGGPSATTVSLQGGGSDSSPANSVHTHNTTVAIGDVQVSVTGATATFSIVQPSVVGNYIISI